MKKIIQREMESRKNKENTLNIVLLDTKQDFELEKIKLYVQQRG